MYALCVPIMLLLTCGFLETMVLRVHDGPPVLPLKWARKLIRRIPSEIELPYFFRVIGFVPNLMLNRSMSFGQTYLRLYLDREYYRIVKSDCSWGAYYKNEFVAEWMFKFATTFLGLFVLVKALPLFTHNRAEAGEMKMPVPDANEKQRRNYWRKNDKMGRFPINGASISESLLCNILRLIQCFYNSRSQMGTQLIVLELMVLYFRIISLLQCYTVLMALIGLILLW